MRIRDPKPEVQRLEELVKEIRRGEIRLPKFQRPFVWNKSDMLNLLDSIYNGYPIGSILLWNSSERLRSERSIFDFNVEGDDQEAYPTDYLLDGQQRLTTLCGALYWNGIDPKSIWNICFDLEFERFVYPAKQDPISLFPLNKLLSTSDFIRQCMRFDHHPKGRLFYDNAEKLLESIKNYKIAVVKIGDISLEEIAPIFERINSTGRKLTMVDLMRAATWKGQFDLSEEIDKIVDSVSDLQFGEMQDSSVLRSISAAAGLGVNKADIDKLRALDAEKLIESSLNAQFGIGQAIDFLSNRIRMPDLTFLPYGIQLTHLAEFFRINRTPSIKSLDALEQWFWITSLAGYFSGANTGQNSKDLERMRSYARGDVDSPLENLPPIDFAFLLEEFNLRTASSITLSLMMVNAQPRVGIFGNPMPVEKIKNLTRDLFLDLIPRQHYLRGKNVVQILNFAWRGKVPTDAALLDADCNLLVGETAADSLKAGDYDSFVNKRMEVLLGRIYDLTGISRLSGNGIQANMFD